MAKIEDGVTAANLVAVDPTMKALRTSIRPMEVLAYQSLGVPTGALTGAAANTPIFSLRNISANLIVIRQVGIGFIATTGFTAAQLVDYGLMVARAFTASDTGQTAISLTGNNAKHRTSLGTVSSVDVRVSNAGAITAGTRTLDTNHLAQVGGWALAATAGVIIAPSKSNLLTQNAGDHPVVLAQNEGIVINNITAMGAAGVGRAYINIEFAEVADY